MKKQIIISIVVLAGLLLGGSFIARPLIVKSGMKSVLHTAGFEQADIESASAVPGGYAFNGIALDSKKHNTVKSVTLRDGELTIDNLALTGDWETTALPSVSGWALPVNVEKLVAALRKEKISSVTLNGGQMDVVLPMAGIVRVQAKGRMDVLPDGTARLQAILWSDEKKITGQVNVTGEFTPDGIASVDFEITDGKITLANFLASRMGGWVIFNKTNAGTPWTISSQIVAGSARLYTMLLHGATFSAQGTTQNAILNLQSSGMEGETAIALDGLVSTTKNTLTATIRTANVAQVLSAIVSGNAGTPGAKAATAGGVIVYKGEAEKFPDTFKSGAVTLTDLYGETWMKGVLRRTETGMDLDIQQVAMKNLAAALGLEKLDTDGTMTGLLSLHRDDKGQTLIDQGLLRATSRGILSYTGKTMPMETGRKDILDVLKSFAYDRVEISVSSTAEKGIEGGITMNGHPVLNLDQKPMQLIFSF